MVKRVFSTSRIVPSRSARYDTNYSTRTMHQKREHLLELLLGWGCFDNSISSEEEIQEKEQVACVHEEGSLDISHVGPATLTSNMLQRVVCQKYTHDHLNNLGDGDNNWIEPLIAAKKKI